MIRQRRIRSIITIILAIPSLFNLYAQDIPKSLITSVEEMAESGYSQESIEEYIETLRILSKNPININSANLEEIESCGILPLYAIQNLIAYRKINGVVGSYSELAAISGFSSTLVKEIQPYITIGKEEHLISGITHRKSRSTNNIWSKISWKSSQQGIYYRSLYCGTYNNFSYSLSGESDAGEPIFMDFISGYAEANLKRIKIILGDYRVQLGQGLTINNSFLVGCISNPTSLIIRPKGTIGYRGSDELNFLRGAAITYCFSDKASALVFASFKGRDANCDSTSYRSLPSYGYHRTEREILSKKRLKECVIGGKIGYSGDRFSISANAVAYCYDLLNGSKRYDYNMFQQYDGWYGNASIDVMLTLGHIRLFGEIASDIKGSIAVITGATYTPSSNFEIGGAFRHYPYKYIATYSSAYSSSSGNYNQDGVIISILYKPNYNWKITLWCDATYYPWARYQIPYSSASLKTKSQIEYNIAPLRVYLKGGYSLNTHFDNRITNYIQHKSSLAIGTQYNFMCGLYISARVDGNIIYECSRNSESEYKYGISTFADGGYKGHNWHISTRLTYFKTTDYDSRIYLYEKDLPRSFSIMPKYGDGLECYLLGNISPLMWLNIIARLSIGYKNGITKTEARLAVEFNF